MRRLVISGMGMVSPAGAGAEDIWNSLETGRSGIGRLSKFSLPGDIRCGEIDECSIGRFTRDGRFRRAAPISQYALAAASSAFCEAGDLSVEADKTALVMGITHGALGYAQMFHKELLEGGMDAASPIHFSDSVLNAPAGNVSMAFAIKGPVNTILGGADAAVKAIMTACCLIDRGAADCAVVVSAEELNELSLACYTRMGMTSLSEGAGAAIIEKEESARGPSPYCLISGMASVCNPRSPDEAIAGAVDRCLGMAGIGAEDVDFVMANEKIAVFSSEGTPSGSIAPFVGNAFAAGMLWEILFSGMALRKGVMPQAVTRTGCKAPRPLNNVMICSIDRQGCAAAILLSACQKT